MIEQSSKQFRFVYFK